MKVGDRYKVVKMMSLTGGDILPNSIIEIVGMGNGDIGHIRDIEFDGVKYPGVFKDYVNRCCIDLTEHRKKVLNNYFKKKNEYR